MMIHTVLAVAMGCCWACGTAPSAPEPIRVGLDRQLFLDELLIADRVNVRFTLHQPVKHPANPVLRAEHPWEAKGVALYGTVLYDVQEGLFKMWYRAMDDTCYACYATSSDGIHWKKPVLNVKPYKGSTANNIVLGSRDPEFYLDGFAVIKEPGDPDPRRRYKMLTFNGRSHFAAMVSPDGIRWTGPINDLSQTDTGDVISMYRDSGLGKYVALLKRRATRVDKQGKRTVCRARLTAFSEDFVRWSPPQWALIPDDQDPPATEFYSHVAFMYEGLRIGYLGCFSVATQHIDTQLCFSRDGLAWHRCRDRVALLPNGPEGSFDAGMLLADASDLVVRDGKIWIYYCGYNVDHEGRAHGRADPDQGIGLAQLRLDGFVSADAGAGGGTLLTRPLVCAGRKLRINAEAPEGEIRAELLDAEGRSLSGHDLAASLPFRGDALDAELTWRTEVPAALVDKPVRIRFHLRNAKLYSFWFAAGGIGVLRGR